MQTTFSFSSFSATKLPPTVLTRVNPSSSPTTTTPSCNNHYASPPPRTTTAISAATTGSTFFDDPSPSSSAACADSMAAAAAAAAATAASPSPKWVQKTITLSPYSRGCHLITPKILKEIGQELSEFECGLAHFFLQHTSASLTINENYDSDVRYDTETFLNRVVQEGRSAPWKHTLEGPDDMPAHIKSSMFGCTLMIPISKGRLNMGTWQGIWLCEHRDLAPARKVVVTLNGI